ncbi:molybdenum cofactor guanylyltransferase [Pseudanabaena sp. Chao 1811]|uniref:molybdenum cofactor guanylyltransferase n=1 Tax=Pseudanabaena sp. Chao 1811 TaxID=2963092 RepID=UPI0022F3F0E1|nr:molybdenum cofactor guanylyltransferase [Pseudanabaena sp. Chao 1811]
MKITAIALSGGKSSRMGRDKALLEINGETLLSQTSRIALQTADSVYIVARSQEQYQSLKIDSQASIHLVLDQKFDGALVGFWQGIQAIAKPTDWILLLACDLPNLQSEVLQTWARQLADLPKTAIAYLPTHAANPDESRKQWEPLCGFYRWQCCDSLVEFIEKGGRSFQKWLDTQEVMAIPNAPLSMLFNCNTPDDFHQYRLSS